VFIMLSIVAAITLGTIWPFVHREREYYYINNHTFGGKRFTTGFSAWNIYQIYFEALLILIVLGLGLAILVVVGGFSDVLRNPALATGGIVTFGRIIGVTFVLGWIVAFAFIRTEVFNLAVSNTIVDERHKFNATLSPWAMIWIGVSNLVLILASIGLLYPWARVRVARYLADHMSLLAASNLEEFTSEAFATQSVIGEEIAGFFDFDIGL
jgi:uncharacterized membrane protein YjgN (DUF898 family)